MTCGLGYRLGFCYRLQCWLCALKLERKWFTIFMDPPVFAHVWQLVIVSTLDLDHFIKNKLERTPDLLACFERKVLVDFLHDFDEFVHVSGLILLFYCLHALKHSKIKDVKVGRIGRLVTEGNIPTYIVRKTKNSTTCSNSSSLSWMWGVALSCWIWIS